MPSVEMPTRLSRHVRLALWLLLQATGACFAAEENGGKSRADHVVLVVWDGMRADFVSETQTPKLWKLAQAGVTFRNHHSVYPTLTTVNAAALATGVSPGRSGMLGNSVFRPDLGGGKLVRLDSPMTIRRGDEITGGKHLPVPTIAELVQKEGGHVAVAGTKTAALLHNRNPRPGSQTLFGGKLLPAAGEENVAKVLGRIPGGTEIPNVAQDAWTTRALTEVLWREGVPKYSVLWVSDPDKSQHATGPGTPASLAGIASADKNLGILLDALDQRGVRDRTDVLVASDHGFSTVTSAIDVEALLRKRGFEVASDNDKTLARGRIRIATNGGTNLCYVGEHDRDAIERLVVALQEMDVAGVIFARGEIDGAFPLSLAGIEAAAGPDVVMSFRWESGRNADGAAGLIQINGRSIGDKGTHGTLSPFDVHNTFVATGPDFRSGMNSDAPTSNLDVAATILHLLGLSPPQPIDGRVVTEAMSGSDDPPPQVEEKKLEAARRVPGGQWRQYLRTSQVGRWRYLDEGNGSLERK